MPPPTAVGLESDCRPKRSGRKRRDRGMALPLGNVCTSHRRTGKLRADRTIHFDSSADWEAFWSKAKGPRSPRKKGSAARCSRAGRIFLPASARTVFYDRHNAPNGSRTGTIPLLQIGVANDPPGPERGAIKDARRILAQTRSAFAPPIGTGSHGRPSSGTASAAPRMPSSRLSRKHAGFVFASRPLPL